MAARVWRRRRTKWNDWHTRRWQARIIRKANGIVPGTERPTDCR